MTACSVSSRWRPTWARLRLPIRRPSAKAVDQDTKYARQSGGKGQYGHVKITIEPNESGKGYEFINTIVGGAIPKEYIPAVDAGIQGAMQSGVLAGYPVVDVKVTLYDGSYHEVDSSEMAFKIAGSMAFKEAMRKADPVAAGAHHEGLPSSCPDEYMGDVIGDLNSRRGQIQGMEIPQRRHSRSTRLFRWPRCSATPPICAPAPRAVASTPWSPATISSCPRALQEKHHREPRKERLN